MEEEEEEEEEEVRYVSFTPLRSTARHYTASEVQPAQLEVGAADEAKVRSPSSQRLGEV